jgi:hypothetical protein
MASHGANTVALPVGESAMLMRYEKEQCNEPVPLFGLHGKPEEVSTGHRHLKPLPGKSRGNTEAAVWKVVTQSTQSRKYAGTINRGRNQLGRYRNHAAD